MKIILTSFVALVSYFVMPSSTLDKHVPEDSAKDFMDCICCLPSQNRITSQALVPVPRQIEQAPAPTLTSPPAPQSELVQAQPTLTVPQQQQMPLSVPMDVPAMPAALQAPTQFVPILVASASGGGCHGGGGGGEYYNYRRFGGRLRLRR